MHEPDLHTRAWNKHSGVPQEFSMLLYEKRSLDVLRLQTKRGYINQLKYLQNWVIMTLTSPSDHLSVRAAAIARLAGPKPQPRMS